MQLLHIYYLYQSADTSATATPEEPKSRCSSCINEEAETVGEEERSYRISSVLNSPTSPGEFSPPSSPSDTRYFKLKSEPIPIGLVPI